MTTHSSILAWKIPWAEEPGKLKSLGVTKNQKWLSMFSHTYTMYSHLIWKSLNWWKCKSSSVLQRRGDSAESSSQKPCSGDGSMWTRGLHSRSLRDAGLRQQRHIFGDKTPVSLEGGGALLSGAVFAKPAILHSHCITSPARALLGAVILLLEMERPTFREFFCLKIESEVERESFFVLFSVSCCLSCVDVCGACGCSWMCSTWKRFLTSDLVLTSLWEICWYFTNLNSFFFFRLLLIQHSMMKQFQITSGKSTVKEYLRCPWDMEWTLIRLLPSCIPWSPSSLSQVKAQDYVAWFAMSGVYVLFSLLCQTWFTF